MPIFIHPSLDQLRLDKARQILDRFFIPDEVDAHSRVPSWDRDGEDVYLARFLCVFADGEPESVSFHAHFYPDSIRLLDVHALFVRSGAEVNGEDWSGFLQQDHAGWERDNIQAAVEQSGSRASGTTETTGVAGPTPMSPSLKSGRNRRL